jgi:hypothetical protein
MDPVLVAYTLAVFAASLLAGVLVCVGGKAAQSSGTVNKDNEK